MSNPGGSVSINALSIAVPAGILVFMITATLFHFKEIINDELQNFINQKYKICKL